MVSIQGTWVRVLSVDRAGEQELCATDVYEIQSTTVSISRGLWAARQCLDSACQLTAHARPSARESQ